MENRIKKLEDDMYNLKKTLLKKEAEIKGLILELKRGNWEVK